MKTSYLISLAVATLILSGCGGSSSTSDTQNTSLTGTTISVERGPILGAKVIDAKGQIASEISNGQYTFSTTPSYPIIATKGVIDMDRDGKISLGDVVNDMNLTTMQGSVVTLLTTLATNTQTKLEVDRLLSDLNITEKELYSETPSQSLEVEAISNVIYKYVKENNISNIQDTNSTEFTSLDVKTEYTAYKNDNTHDVKTEEIQLVDSLLNNGVVVDKLDNDVKVSDALAVAGNELSQNELTEIENHLSTLKSEYESSYGDMDYVDEGSDTNHYQGVSCASCHSSAGTVPSSSEGNEGRFDSGATIFTTLSAANSDATKAASSYSLRLVLSGGAIENYNVGRGTGNVNGTFNAGIASYTAEVLDRSGNVVNSSATNSHDATRLDCNSCHTAIGTNGAPGRIVSFQYSTPVTTTATVDTNLTTTTTPTTTTTTPTTPTTTTTTPTTVVAKSFANDVLPILTASCQGCHGISGNFSITTSTTPYAGVIPFVNTTSASTSSLLQKASGSVYHGGNIVLSTTSTGYITIRDWISEGALNN